MNILSDCLKISAVLKAKKLVNVFLNYHQKYQLIRLLKTKNINHLTIEMMNAIVLSFHPNV